ncbi:MAG TPA: hypothetical protein VJ596_01895 [Gemmatimonadaceae bacterium]|nr:hypothetical protein [Gemmatimonadaceae bacterium]
MTLPAIRFFPLLLALATPVVLHAQSTITARAAFRATPNGRVLATIERGAALDASSTRAGYTRVELEGFLHRSLLAGRRDSFPRSVNAPSGALLRAAPQRRARVVARLDHGMGVHELSRRGEWVRVRRTAWVATQLVRRPPTREERPAVVARAPETPATPPPAKSDRGASASDRQDEQTAESPGAVESDPEETLSRAQRELAPTRRTPLATAPDGQAIATIDSGARLTPMARERGWVRVQMDGWVREIDLAPADSAMRASLSAADLRADPQAARGKVVRWEVQSLAFQRADPLRKDLAPDEPYLLARGPRGENAIIYLALPPSLVDEAQKIPPLAVLVVTARVRVPRSEPAGVPILDVQNLALR